MATIDCLHPASKDHLTALIFVHGLGGDPVLTWMHPSGDRSSFWPVWIGQDTGCAVWTLNYDAALSGWQDSAMPLPDQGVAVLDCLVNEPQLRGRGLVLIGHSLGGLVIKSALVQGRTTGVDRYIALTEQVRAVSFLATPHNGSQLATLAKAVSAVLRTNAQVGDLGIHHAHLRSLHQQFQKVQQDLTFAVRTYAEQRGVPLGRRVFGLFLGKRITVVDPSSAEPHVPGEIAIGLPDDHFSICKPASKAAQIHKSLLGLIYELQQAPLPPSSAPDVTPRPTPATQPPVWGAAPEARSAEAGSAAGGIARRETGRLSGTTDNRLQPREGKVYGRATEVARVLAFLRGGESAAVVSAQVTGMGGIGKTEVCKAALKNWLLEQPGAAAFYIDIPDQASPAELVYRMGRALGAENVKGFEELTALLPDGLYYLDNLESVAEHAEGRELLRKLRDRPGVRVLASSRVSLPTVLGRPIEIDVLPEDAALALFRDLWAGRDPLHDAAGLTRFVVEDLGCHALSITLTARLGDSYPFDRLVHRWRECGAVLARDASDETRLGSLPVSLRLTSDALAQKPGALALWTLAALFAGGIEDEMLSAFEKSGAWGEGARQSLVRHHVLVRRGTHLHLLPPVARYALDMASAEQAGFSWSLARPHAYALFRAAAATANRAASTDDALGARGFLLAHFGALHRFVMLEAACPNPDRRGLQALDTALRNQYQFRAGLAVEMLRALCSLLEKPAGTTLTLGYLESHLGRPDEARALYDRALSLYEREQSDLGQANTLKALGELESRLGRPDEARALYDRALSLYEREQEGLGQANTLQALGDLERRLGRPDEARALYDRALPLYEREQSGLGQANTLHTLGELESGLGRPDEARALHDRALSLYEREQSDLGQANTLKALGELESRLGRPDEARALYDRALSLYEREQEGLGQANTLQALGDLFRDSRSPERGLPIYERALALYRAEQTPMGTAYTLAEIGRCLHAAGREADRDQALVNGLTAAQASGVESVTSYVMGVVVEVTGGPEAAQAWVGSHPVGGGGGAASA